jgi:hypothetical protein
MKNLVMLLVSIGMGGGMALAQTVNFDTFKIGEPPPGWAATKTGNGPGKMDRGKGRQCPEQTKRA